MSRSRSIPMPAQVTETDYSTELYEIADQLKEQARYIAIELMQADLAGEMEEAAEQLEYIAGELRCQ